MPIDWKPSENLLLRLDRFGGRHLLVMPIDWKLQRANLPGCYIYSRHLLVMPIDWKLACRPELLLLDEPGRHLLVMPIDWKLIRRELCR